MPTSGLHNSLFFCSLLNFLYFSYMVLGNRPAYIEHTPQIESLFALLYKCKNILYYIITFCNLLFMYLNLAHRSILPPLPSLYKIKPIPKIITKDEWDFHWFESLLFKYILHFSSLFKSPLKIKESSLKVVYISQKM